ncbi:hypothetical protein P154DRAFT_313305 [Amniculicola lignicola CBS 123094]|uniref:Uncharacterized protein n=1 Tax=Amniculicola lignicola CBS 123094 TaxID=1392246 RepID=A0A6A5WWR7_9PLEO|nr:hypothetical protein P154DRAFT_313305 [Amniculicola lignicola CBS 123094]
MLDCFRRVRLSTHRCTDVLGALVRVPPSNRGAHRHRQESRFPEHPQTATCPQHSPQPPRMRSIKMSWLSQSARDTAPIFCDPVFLEIAPCPQCCGGRVAEPAVLGSRDDTHTNSRDGSDTSPPSSDHTAGCQTCSIAISTCWKAACELPATPLDVAQRVGNPTLRPNVLGARRLSSGRTVTG